jgi:PAS domain S-box-containing protein
LKVVHVSLRPKHFDGSKSIDVSSVLEGVRRHELELEAEALELRRALAEAEASKTRYFDLYDLAPVGYLTLSQYGLILEMNLKAAALFGVNRADWNDRNFKFFIASQDQDVYYHSQKLLAETGAPQRCELRMFRNSGLFWAHLVMASDKENGARVCRIVFADINDRKTAQLEREQNEIRLQRLLTENNTQTKEMYHRVKNNLQVISSLLRMQGELLNDQRAAAALKECHQRIMSMALIHERLSGNERMDEIDFGEFTQTLVSELFSSYGYSDRITCRLNISAVVLNADQAIPCGLVVNELVTNALKYAYPDGQSGEVRVDLRETAGLVELVVSDQGVGLPPELDWRNSESVGLPIVDVLAKQIGGKLTLSSSKGTSFRVEFPRG